MSFRNSARSLPPVKVHMLLTYDRLKHYEECERELAAIKHPEKAHDRPSDQSGAGNNHNGEGKWHNRAELLIPEAHNMAEAGRNYPPLLTSHADVERDEEGHHSGKEMSGAGATD